MRSYSTRLIFSIILPSLPTPLGSTIRYSGSTAFAIVSIEAAKSPFVEQHIQPSVSSHILISFSSALFLSLEPSIPKSLYSFSRMANSLLHLFTISFIKVVFPAPKKPDITSIFIY